MAAIALITAANVVVRYLTNISFAFTEEYSVVLMVMVTILGTSLAMAGGRHIKIEYFTYLLSTRGRQIAEIVAMALVIVCFGIIWSTAPISPGTNTATKASRRVSATRNGCTPAGCRCCPSS